MMTEKETTCSLCGEDIADEAQYYDIDSGNYHLCAECYDGMDVDEAVDLFDVMASDIFDMHNVVKKTHDNKPAPEPLIPGQIEITDDGQLREYAAAVSA